MKLLEIIQPNQLRTAWELMRIGLGKQYKESFMGILWMLMQPAFFISIMAVVFSYLVRFGVEDYVVYLISGILPWQFLSGSMGNGCTALIGRSVLIRGGCQIPRTLFVMSDIMQSMYTLFISVTIMYLIAGIYSSSLQWTALLFPVVLIPMYITAFALALILGYVTVYIRDASYVVRVLLNPIIWLMPIMYPISYVPERFQFIANWNPFYILIKPSQIVLYHGEIPSALLLLKGCMVAAMACLLAYIIVKKCQRNIVYYL